MNLSSITRLSNRTVLKLKKNSPQILFVGGIIGTVATTVLASRATLKAVPVMNELTEAREALDVGVTTGEVDRDHYGQIAVQQYTVAAMDLTKLYGPVVIIGVGSLYALTKSHQQLNARNTALTVAYTGLFKTFEAYRARVQADLGPERDRQFLHGTVQEEIEYVDKQGKTRTKEITALDASSAAALTLYYDKDCGSWVKHPGYNQNTLDGIEVWANTLLQKQGHLFLNELYDLLKVPHTKEGAILGWVHKDYGNNDTFITLGHGSDTDFVNGFKTDVMLEFNIHGPILDLI